MRILCMIDSLGSGGAQRQLINLAISFKELGQQVSFLTYYDDDFYASTLKNADIEHTCLQVKHPLKRIWQTRKFIRSGNFQGIIAFLGVPGFLAECASLPSKKWTLISGERSANPLILTSKKKKIIAFFHLFANWVVSNSRANLSMVQKVNPFLNKKKCQVIYNAIDLNLFSPANGFQFKKQKRLKIIVPASYRRLKNLLGLIEAVNLLNASEKESLQIDWYGDKSFNFQSDFSLSEAEERIKEYNLETVFQLNGPTKEIHRKIRSADIVGLFSFHEGQPNSVCEGMACGKPILASAVSDLPLIIEDHINGKLCNPKDIHSIASGIRFFLSLRPDQMEKMGRLNRQKALELFDQDKIALAYLALLDHKQ